MQCPHCWNKFPVADVLWIATHPDLLGDPVLSADDPLRFLPSRFTTAGTAIDERGSTCQSLACPRCHLGIANVLLEHPTRILSIVGTPSSGKSYFLTSCAWQLRQKLGASFALAFSDADPVSNRVLTSNEQQLFLQDDPEKLVFLEKTQLEGSAYDSVQLEPGQATILPQPYLFTIRPTSQHVNARGAAKLTEVLCLYDNAGEHFLPGSESPLSPTTQHLARSKNLMFVFDPTQDARFRARLRGLSSDPQLGQLARAFRQDVVLLEMASRVRLHSGMPADEKLRQPLTIVVTKSDIWESLLSGEDIRSDPYLIDQRDDGGMLGVVDKGRVERVSDLLESLLTEIVPEFISAVRDTALRVLYVPVSATGVSPQIESSSGMLKVKASKIDPWWVTVPFIYEFSRWKNVVGSTRESSARTSEIRNTDGV
ncbi:MAG: hypothetical protein EXS17_07280 [Phycisphaerales bacterium]|nr:hypothetical protein [Phycisphaerales bacterium]